MSDLFSIFIGLALVNNIVLFQLLGLCPVFGVTKRLNIAVNMGMAVSLVILVSSVVSWLIYNYILTPLDAEYLNLLMYLLVIGLLVQLIAGFIRRTSEKLYKSFGIYILFIANCAVLGVLLINADNSYTLLESIVAAVGAGIGFTLIMIIMSGIRERLELANAPKAMKGLPAVFITAAILAMSFYGFTGI